MKKLIFAAALLAAASVISCNDKKAAGSSGWQLVWEENFDGDTVDSTVWSRIDRGTADWNNYMSKADTLYALRDGNLVLRGIANYPESGDTVPYLTGGVYSKHKKAFGNGRIEIRAKLQGAKGAWPAIWMLPDTGAWPRGGEIDIMERLSHDSIAYQTIHTYYSYVLGHSDNPPHGSTGRINPDDYNVYAVELLPDSLRFFINDTHTFTYPRIDTEIEGQWPFNSEFYLLIDMQLGGSWVGEVNPEELPVEMLVDWVRFYKKEEK